MRFILIRRLVAICTGFAALGLLGSTQASDGTKSAPQPGKVPPSWIFVGNEKEEVTDPETGKLIRYLTAGKSLDSHFHYSNGTWGEINGNTYLFFQSSRKRPASAGETEPGEYQLMAVNVKTGDLYHLTTVPVDGGPDQYITVRPYFATYNDVAKSIFFFNKGLTKIYAYDCLTGEQKVLLELPAGASGRALDEFVDESMIRIVYPYTVKGENGVENFIAVADFRRDGALIGNQVVVRSAPPSGLNHAEFCPADKNLFFYKLHRVGGFGSGKRGAENQDLYLRDISAGTDQHVRTNDLKIGHMIWGKSGDHIYWSNTQPVGIINKYNWRTNEAQVTEGVHTYHNQVSGDEQMWVYDGGSYKVYSTKLGKADVKNGEGHIGIYNMKTGVNTKYANIILADPHPRHAHPQFSLDDSMISFVTGAAVDSVNTRVAVMPVEK